jgi:hypothetical protein
VVEPELLGHEELIEDLRPQLVCLTDEQAESQRRLWL